MEKYTDRIILIGKKAFRRYSRAVNNINLCEDEFISSAAVGTAKAFKKFNPSKSANLMSYAFPYIKEEIRILLTDKMEHNKHNRHLDEVVTTGAVKKQQWPKFMCMADLLSVFSHLLDENEKKIICLKHCDDLSDYKIGQGLGVSPRQIKKIARGAHNKIRGEILRYGDVEDINDIRSNILKVFADRKRHEMLEKIKDDNPELQ